MEHPSKKTKYYAVYLQALAAIEQRKSEQGSVDDAFLNKQRERVQEAAKVAMWNGAKSIRADAFLFANPKDYWLKIICDDPGEQRRQHEGRKAMYERDSERLSKDPDYCIGVAPRSSW